MKIQLWQDAGTNRLLKAEALACSPLEISELGKHGVNEKNAYATAKF